MSARKPLPEIAPCPCPKRCKAEVVRFPSGLCWVQSKSVCAWKGPRRWTLRAAILAWNRRSDEAAERRGAEAAFLWMQGAGYVGAAKEFSRALQRGEVVGKPDPWVVSRPGVMGGKPCVRGTRITVETIKAVSTEWTFLQILEQYPGLTVEGLAAALAHIWKEDKGEVAGKRGRRG